jgi:opacity protein-like surface antigen
MRSRFTLFFSVLFISSIAFSQQIRINKGDFDATGSAELSQAELGLDLRWGAFIADYRQLGIQVGYADTDLLTQMGLGAYYLQFFETNTYALPYVGGGLGFNSLSPDFGSDTSGLAVSLILGVRYYFSSSVALNTEFRVAWSSDDTFIDDTEATDSDFRLGVGLTYLW